MYILQNKLLRALSKGSTTARRNFTMVNPLKVPRDKTNPSDNSTTAATVSPLYRHNADSLQDTAELEKVRLENRAALRQLRARVLEKKSKRDSFQRKQKHD